LRGLKKSRGEKSKTTYHLGAFGLSIEPEIDLDGIVSTAKPKPSKVIKVGIKKTIEKTFHTRDCRVKCSF